MGKRVVFKWVMLLPAVLLTLSGCNSEDPVIAGSPELPPTIGAKGGVVEGLNGEVVLSIPPGALTENVSFSIYELNFNAGTSEAELIRPFVIEPYVIFNVPAKLMVYTDGILSNGAKFSEGMDVYLYIWGNLDDYCNKTGNCCITCCEDVKSWSLSSCLGKTGVITAMRKNGGSR